MSRRLAPTLVIILQIYARVPHTLPVVVYSEPSSPLQHSHSAMEKLIYMAENRLSMVHSPAQVMGGTAPVTLDGGLV